MLKIKAFFNSMFSCILIISCLLRIFNKRSVSNVNASEDKTIAPTDTFGLREREVVVEKKTRWRWWLSDKDLGGSTSVGDDVNATRQDGSGLYLRSTSGVDACGGIGGEDASLANFNKELLLRQ